MSTLAEKDLFLEECITYTLIKDEKLYVILNVPVRVDINTGEQLFSPETVERLQSVIWEKEMPVQVLRTPVYEFAPV
ncbi:MAG: hypothetical protein HUU23_01225 [Caldilineales bacterium]|nr:hypothetical protein [Caldilineales bacterium]